MLYSRSELPNSFVECNVALQRYLHMFANERKKIAKLKWHEKDFLFQNMRSLIDSQGNHAFDLLDIAEAEDYVMYLLILLFASDGGIIDLKKEVKDYYGVVPKKRKELYVNRYLLGMEKWSKRLEDTGGDPYLTVLNPLYKVKYKELKSLYLSSAINMDDLQERILYMKSMFFHTMYNARVYFDEKPSDSKCVHEVINGCDVYADIYTYCHVFIRHYYPQMNIDGIGGTLNSNIKAIEMRDLPVSLLRLVRLHSEFSGLTSQTQYLLYEFEREKYIMWLKYKNLGYKDKGKGIRICSFYKCIHPRDLSKYVDKTPHDVIKDLITIYA